MSGANTRQMMHIRPAAAQGYAPPNRDREEQVLRNKREEYTGWVAQYYEQDETDRDDADLVLSRQIIVDVPRTAPGVSFFHRPQIQKSIERILFIRAIRNPASGYVQGINDLVTPFLSVFLSEVFAGSGADMDLWDLEDLSSTALGNVEADCYWCLAKLLDCIQDHYTFAQPGIQRQVFKLGELVRRIDAAMFDHIEGQGLQFLQFAFRWYNCLMLREVPFSLAGRLWDTYLSETAADFAEFLVYCGAALLLTWADEMKGMEFQDLVIFLQHLPTQQWGVAQLEMVLSKAFLWRSVFASAQSHLLRS